MYPYGSYTYHGEHLVVYINIESLCCTPEANIILYVNYTSIKKKKKRNASKLEEEK